MNHQVEMMAQSAGADEDNAASSMIELCALDEFVELTGHEGLIFTHISALEEVLGASKEDFLKGVLTTDCEKACRFPL